MASRILAAAYGQSPDYFDGWPVARVEREIEIYRAIRGEGDEPLTTGAFVEVVKAVFGGGK